MDGRLKHPLIEGESAIERKRRLHRISGQRYKLKVFPNRKVGSRRKPGLVTKEYLLSCCKTDTVTGCWVWQKGKTEFGYGSIRENDRLMLAHRRAYELWVGHIPAGLFVCHKCDNPPCFNPSHLFLGTDQDNQDDCYAKGRMPLGPDRPNSKLNASQVREIRASNSTLRELSEIYGIGQTSLHKVKNNITYKSVT
jgi:hypothetical protein